MEFSELFLWVIGVKEHMCAAFEADNIIRSCFPVHKRGIWAINQGFTNDLLPFLIARHETVLRHVVTAFFGKEGPGALGNIAAETQRLFLRVGARKKRLNILL